jgi:hypothetical protein
MMARDGSFEGLMNAAPYAEVNSIFEEYEPGA